MPYATILVAEGVYRPDEDEANPDGTGDGEAAFILPEGITLRGGYAGYGAPDPDANDPAQYPTILSGDLNEDDQPGFVNYTDNSRHVVRTGGDAGTNVTLSGVTIRGGYSTENSGQPWVAGGSAVYCDGVHLLLTDCVIADNHTGLAGGAVYSRTGAPTIERCTFTGNAGGYGAALNTWSGAPTVCNSQFLDNHSDYSGGAIANEADLSLIGCLFTGNSAAVHGGAIDTAGAGELHVLNCTLAANEAASVGGGIRATSSTLVIEISNSILWQNADAGGTDESAQFWYAGGDTLINYNCFQGWTGTLGGEGNTGDDPLLASNHPSPGSPCIDAGDNTAVPADEFDLDSDGDTTEPIPFDLAGDPRFVDDPNTIDTGNPGAPGPLVDMGAYESQGTSCPGDLDGDGDTDQSDLGLLLAAYEFDDGGDLDGDGDTDQGDLGLLLADYGCGV